MLHFKWNAKWRTILGNVMNEAIIAQTASNLLTLLLIVLSLTMLAQILFATSQTITRTMTLPLALWQVLSLRITSRRKIKPSVLRKIKTWGTGKN
jgi:hypothetical protein